jgi:DNA-directed RNA polymerase specialized sigma24 family protein
MQWLGIHALVQRAKTGDRRAWEELDALVLPYLLNLADRLLDKTWPYRSSSDLLQDVRLRAWQNLHQFQGGDDDLQTGILFRAWLARIMRNCHSNGRRSGYSRRHVWDQSKATPILGPRQARASARAEFGG